MCLHAPCNGASADGENYQTSACGPFAHSLKIKIRFIMRDLIKNTLPQKYYHVTPIILRDRDENKFTYQSTNRRFIYTHTISDFFFPSDDICSIMLSFQ